MAIKVEIEWCKGCGVCIEKCPAQCLVFSKEFNKKGYFPPILTDEKLCNSWQLCELICPDFAIGVIIEEDEEEGKGD